MKRSACSIPARSVPNPNAASKVRPDCKPANQIPVAGLWRRMGPLARVLALPIYAYRYTLSPFIGHACRHQPTCSVYALEALALHGPFRGFSLGLRRLLRCHPWGGSGYDPVPNPKKLKPTHGQGGAGQCPCSPCREKG